jgi:hypothetical protein
MYFKFIFSMRLLFSLFVLAQHDGFTHDGFSEYEDLLKLSLCPAEKSTPDCLVSLPNSDRNSALKIPSFHEQLRPKVAVIGGGLLGVLTALDLNSVGFDVTLFESSPEVISGASQTAAVLHAGGGEYLHIQTKVDCQETGVFFKARFPRLYEKSTRSIIFAPELHSSLKCNTVNIFLKDFIWRKPS